MNRVKGKKYPNDDLYKEYMILKNRITKSDKILITSIDGMRNDMFTAISYRKLFVRKHIENSYGFYRMRNEDFQNWVIMKQRLNKLNKLKSKLNG